MKKILGIFGLLAVVILATAIMTDAFLTPYNLENLIRRTSLFGIISVGVAFVIITGGIDLSIGSVICLIGCGSCCRFPTSQHRKRARRKSMPHKAP